MLALEHLKIIKIALEEALHRDARWAEAHYYEAKEKINDWIALAEADKEAAEKRAAIARDEEKALADAKAKEEAAIASIGIGDFVMLNSGGPVMKVIALPEKGVAECTWEDQEDIFDVLTLTKVPAPPEPTPAGPQTGAMGQDIGTGAGGSNANQTGEEAQGKEI